MENVEKNTSRIERPQDYEAPAIIGLEVEVEKGFAHSGGPPPPGNPINPGW